MSGLTIYEPVSFATGARNQAEMGVGLVEFALDNLCLSAGCDLEEAAARLGYAAWNLDKAFQRQLAEASDRGQLNGTPWERLASDAAAAAGACRSARGELLAVQPQLPDGDALGRARRSSESCLASLQGIVAAL
jgi:hypothetical protein